MQKIMTRFGEVEYDPGKTIEFPSGLIGFEDLRNFIVMPNRKEGPLFWIQSVEEPDIAFVLTDPSQFFLDYRLAASDDERNRLDIGKDDDCLVLSVVTVPPDKKITMNLVAPILFAPATKLAIQVILDNSPYETRTPLPELKGQR